VRDSLHDADEFLHHEFDSFIKDSDWAGFASLPYVLGMVVRSALRYPMENLKL
jgi:hypothetical protein